MSRFNFNRLPPTRKDRSTVMFVFRGKARGNTGVTITSQPTAQVVNDGATATFSVTATGATTYQWQKQEAGGGSWSDISGATSSSYTTGTLSNAADNGDYYRVVINGTVTSDAALLSIIATVTVDHLSGSEFGQFATSTGYRYPTGIGSRFMYSIRARKCVVALNVTNIAFIGFLRYRLDGGSIQSPTLSNGAANFTLWDEASDTTKEVEIWCTNGGANFIGLKSTGSITTTAIGAASSDIVASPKIAQKRTMEDSYWSGTGRINQQTQTATSGYTTGNRGAQQNFGSICFNAKASSITCLVQGTAGHRVELTVDGTSYSVQRCLAASGNTVELLTFTGLDSTEEHEYELIPSRTTSGGVPSIITFNIGVAGTFSSSAVPAPATMGVTGHSFVANTTTVGSDSDSGEHKASDAYWRLLARGLGYVTNAAAANGATTPSSSSDSKITAMTLSPNSAMIFMNYGANDAYGVDSVTAPSPTTQANFETTINALLGNSPSATLYVYQLTPRNTSGTTTTSNETIRNQIIDQAIAAVIAATPAYSSRIVLLTCGSGWINGAGDTSDGLHPTAAGNRKIYRKTMQQLGKNMPAINVVASAASATSVKLDWTNEDDANSVNYTVRISTDQYFGTTVATDTVTVSASGSGTYTFTGLSAGTKYWCEVYPTTRNNSNVYTRSNKVQL